MQETTEIDCDRSWCAFKDKDPFQTITVVRNYFETNLLLVFKQNSSIWVLKSATATVMVMHGSEWYSDGNGNVSSPLQ